MGKFKVGDRVRFVMDYGHAKKGDEGTIVSFWAEDGAVVTHKTVNHSCNFSRIELVPVASAEWQPKVGDRVLFTDAVPSHWFFGPATQHKEGVIRSDSEGSGGLRFTVNVGNSYGYVNLEHIEPAAPIAAPAQPADKRANAGGGFKAGDRIRLVKDPVAKHCQIGDEFIAVARGDRNNGVASSVHYTGKDGSKTWRPGSYFDLVEPLTITAGRYYKTRDGRKVGPLQPKGIGFKWENHGESRWIKADGTHEFGMSNCDLIAEWVDEPVAIANDNAAPVKFRVGDRVITKSGYTFDGAPGTIVEVNVNGDADLYHVKIENHPHAGDNEWSVRTDYINFVSTRVPAIVALIENGVALPSTRPVVHASKEAATTEASRLALLHPGQEFGVFVLADSKIADVVEEVVKKTVLRAA